MSKYYCTTVQSYNSSKDFLKAKLRPAQVLRPSLGQKRTPKAKQHTSMRANGRATWQIIKSVFDSRNGFLVLLRSFLYITLCDNFSSSKSYSRNTLGKKVRHWGLNPWPPEGPRGLEFNMNSIWILQSPTELLVNSTWIQDLTFGDFSCSIRLIWVAMQVLWIVQNEAIMLLLSLYYYHYQISPLSNLCQIPDKVPKFTLLLCRFSVYLILPLCLSLLGSWVLPFLICKTSPPGQRIIYIGSRGSEANT